MLNIAMLMVAGLVILGIARYNKSNKLFWQLLMATLLGFAGGHIGAAYSSSKNKSTKTEITAPTTHLTMANFIEDLATLDEFKPLESPVKVERNTCHRDIVLTTTTRKITFNPDYDIGLDQTPHNTS